MNFQCYLFKSKFTIPSSQAFDSFRDSGRRARLMREEDEVAEELTERIGFTMKETKKEDEYHAKVTNNLQSIKPFHSLLKFG